MSPIKSDLICEIIRNSQTNFLEKKGWADPRQAEACEQFVLAWVKNNAKQYRDYYASQLQTLSASRLGEILKQVTESGQDLTEIISNNGSPFAKKTESGSVSKS